MKGLDMVRSAKTLVEPGSVLVHFSATEANDFAQTWLTYFGGKGRGVNAKDFMWHVLSGGCYPCTEGRVAWEDYTQQHAVQYVVLSNDRKNAILTNARPTNSAFSDCYIFPLNFAWTMVLTHEDGWLGPYFAKHVDYEKLNRANLLELKKAQEFSLARNKGWC